MGKRFFLFFSVLVIFGCGELQEVVNQLPGGAPVPGNEEIAQGLRQALTFGIEKQVSKLALQDGFYKNPLVRVSWPQELQKVEQGLRDAGLGKLADEGLMLLNRAAEDAVSEAIPIFAQAVREITFNDARDILLGGDDSATNYLITATESSLYSKFQPVIEESFREVGADEIWANLINSYNRLPFSRDVNPDLPDYVTTEALKGVYSMIALEEKEIRTKLGSRTTNLLRRVFALQDNKQL